MRDVKLGDRYWDLQAEKCTLAQLWANVRTFGIKSADPKTRACVRRLITLGEMTAEDVR